MNFSNLHPLFFENVLTYGPSFNFHVSGQWVVIRVLHGVEHF